jgi:hypothetical protein
MERKEGRELEHHGHLVGILAMQHSTFSGQGLTQQGDVVGKIRLELCCCCGLLLVAGCPLLARGRSEFSGKSGMTK